MAKNAVDQGISVLSFRIFNVDRALKNAEGIWLKIKHEGATYLIPSILRSSEEKLLSHLDNPGHKIINLGTATGSTVLEVVKAAEVAIGRKLILNLPIRELVIAMHLLQAIKLQKKY